MVWIPGISCRYERVHVELINTDTITSNEVVSFIICQLQLVEQNLTFSYEKPFPCFRLLLHRKNLISQHKHVHVIPQVYRIQSPNTGWQWTSGSRIETLWKMHEEIYTCFQVTEAGILKRDAEFSVCLCTLAWAYAWTAQLPSFTCSDTQGTKAAVDHPVGPTRPTSSWPGEMLWNSAALCAEDGSQCCWA